MQEHAIQVTEIHDLKRHPENVGESALGNTPHEGHLAALEPRRDAAAGPRLLALVTPAAGLALAGTGPADWRMEVVEQARWRSGLPGR